MQQINNMESLLTLRLLLLCAAFFVVTGVSAQGSSFEGTWRLDEENTGDFVEIAKTNGTYVVERVSFNVFSQSMEKERFPAFLEGVSLTIRASIGLVPVLYEQDSDTLTVNGHQSYRRMSESVSDASSAWMTARNARIDENKRLCKELKTERDSREANARKDPDTWAEFKAEMKARTPKGCLMPILF